MIRKNEEKTVTVKSELFGGNGQATVRSLFNGPEDFYNKGRVFAHTSLQPGCSIGYHVHHNEAEAYYILSGHGEYNDNGTLTPIGPGDVTICWAEEGHGIACTGDEPLHFIALIYNK